ncbi:MAG TPA: hypothetical protein VFZ78_04915 [Flavisolibacter sp.]
MPKLRGKILSCCLVLISIVAIAQEKDAISILRRNVDNARSDEGKIQALGKLADYYYAFKLEKQADSIQQQQLTIAKLSVNRKLILTTLFNNSIASIGNWNNKETFDRAIDYIDLGLAYAREEKQRDYEALAHIRKAAVLRKRGHLDNAMQEAMQAFTTIDNLRNDSLRAVFYLELGDILLAKDEAVSAYKNYNNAYDLAYQIKNKSLQALVFHHFASLYYRLNDRSLAENNLLKSVSIHNETGDREGLLHDYIDLARFIEKKEYIERALILSAQLNLFKEYLYSKQLMMAYYMIIEKNSRAALQYLFSNTDLHQSYKNRGRDNYYVTLGNCYRYGLEPDSALYYYRLAEPEITRSFETNVQLYLLKEMAACFKMKNDVGNAISYYERAHTLNRDLQSLTLDSSITNNLNQLYVQVGDYRKAYEYSQLYHKASAQLQLQANKGQLSLLAVDRENKKHEKDLADADARKLRLKNLQYMGISIGIALFFLLLILVGMFPVSRFTIRTLGFFAFICLFEFFIVMIDSYLHHISHGEPLTIWMYKVGIISLLVPLHHYLEHGMVHFLESKKLMKLRQQLSVKKLWYQVTKPAPAAPEPAEKEEDPAIL